MGHTGDRLFVPLPERTSEALGRSAGVTQCDSCSSGVTVPPLWVLDSEGPSVVWGRCLWSRDRVTETKIREAVETVRCSFQRNRGMRGRSGLDMWSGVESGLWSTARTQRASPAARRLGDSPQSHACKLTHTCTHSHREKQRLTGPTYSDSSTTRVLVTPVDVHLPSECLTSCAI